MAASLPSDILDLICKKVKLDVDYVRFRSVCKSWRSIAPKRCKKSLFLIRHQSSNFMIGTKFFYRISFQTNEILVVRGPSKSSSPSTILNNNGMVCIGSSLGWMALIHHLTKSMFLYNPITHHIVNLPDFPKCGVHLTDRKCYERIDFIMSSDPVISPVDCVVLIMNDCYEKSIYYVTRNDNNTWNQFSFNIFYSSSSIPHLSNRWGKRACFCNGNLYLTIMGKLVKNSGKFHAEWKAYGKEVCFDYRHEEELSDHDESYVVEKDGDVLLVLVNLPHSLKEGYNFRLYKLIKERRSTCYGEEIVSLEKVESLGDKVIFLSHKTSFCVTASDYYGCKENRVYYVARYNAGRKRTMKIRVHDLTDHSDVVLKDSAASSRRDWELCSWFAPSLQP